MEEAVFGALAFVPGNGSDGIAYWEKPEYTGLFDTTIPLRIYAGTQGPTAAQQQAYSAFRQAEKKLRAELQEALFDFYQSEREVYADIYADICADASLGLGEEDFVPVLETSDQIWKILMPDSWVIETETEEHAIVIYCHGCWDIEHGFSILFKEGQLLGIEAMGGIFYAYPNA